MTPSLPIYRDDPTRKRAFLLDGKLNRTTIPEKFCVQQIRLRCGMAVFHVLKDDSLHEQVLGGNLINSNRLNPQILTRQD